MEAELQESDDEDWNQPFHAVGDAAQQQDQSFTKIEQSTHSLNNSYNSSGCEEHRRVIIHIDIDCFYAQVEMIRNPELRNKPLGIQQKYIIVTCNYVARERGLNKLMTLKDAKEKCPDLVLVSGEDLTHYRNMSYKISNYLVERLGFDENFLDVTDLVNDRMNSQSDVTKRINSQSDVMTASRHVKGHLYNDDTKPEKCGCGCYQRLMVGSHIAHEIREGLAAELGITCCAGISYNKLLSKLVAGTHKPNQQTTLFPHQVPGLLRKLNSVRCIPGIGHSSARHLQELGIVSVVDLQEADGAMLRQELGEVTMVTMKKLSSGVDDSPVVAFGLPQTLSDEDSFRKCSTMTDARAKISELLTNLLNRLLEDGRTPRTLRLTVRHMTETNKYHRESRQCPIPTNVFNKFSQENMAQVCSQLDQLAMSLFHKLVEVKKPFHLTLINVAFAKMEARADNAITSFFSPRPATVAQNKLSDQTISRTSQKMTDDLNTKGCDLYNEGHTNCNLDIQCHKNLETSFFSPKSATTAHSGLPTHSSIEPTITSRKRSLSVGQADDLGSEDHDLDKKGHHCESKDQKRMCVSTEFKSCKEAKLPTANKRISPPFPGRTKTQTAFPCIPAGIDEGVFLELPAHIQQELLQNMSGLPLHEQNYTQAGSHGNRFAETEKRERESSTMLKQRPDPKTKVCKDKQCVNLLQWAKPTDKSTKDKCESNTVQQQTVKSTKDKTSMGFCNADSTKAESPEQLAGHSNNTVLADGQNPPSASQVLKTTDPKVNGACSFSNSCQVKNDSRDIDNKDNEKYSNEISHKSRNIECYNIENVKETTMTQENDVSYSVDKVTGALEVTGALQEVQHRSLLFGNDEQRKSCETNITTYNPSKEKMEIPYVNRPCPSTEKLEIPPHVDRSVFLTLPTDIQQELVDNWKQSQGSHKVERSATNQSKATKLLCTKQSTTASQSTEQQKISVHTNIAAISLANQCGQPKTSTTSKPFFKSPKPSKTNNILSYFPKK